MLGWRKRRDDSAETPGGNPKGEDLRCSFCNKRQAAVRKLIAGPTVHICDECVAVCVNIIADDQRFDRREQRSLVEPVSGTVRGSTSRDAVSCSLCRRWTVLENALIVHDRGVLCGACADAVEDALREGRPVQ